MWKLPGNLLIHASCTDLLFCPHVRLRAVQSREDITRVWETDSWSSAATELSLSLPANSGIAVAMQRIHHHTGRQAGKQAG